MFDRLKDWAGVEAFDNEEYSGLDITWSLTGHGFGHIAISRSKKTGEWRVDDEEESAENVAKILALLKESMRPEK